MAQGIWLGLFVVPQNLPEGVGEIGIYFCIVSDILLHSIMNIFLYFSHCEDLRNKGEARAYLHTRII